MSTMPLKEVDTAEILTIFDNTVDMLLRVFLVPVPQTPLPEQRRLA
jgi:hypothetical protein